MHPSIPAMAVQAPSLNESPYLPPPMTPISEEPPRHGLTHRASRVEQWIEDQQVQDDEDVAEDAPREGTRSNPYLAYPQRSLWSVHTEQSDYILVNEETDHQDKVGTPHTPTQSTKRTSGIFSTPLPLRSFRFPLSPRRSSAAPQPSSGHSRGLSLPALNTPYTSSPMLLESPPRRPQLSWNVTSRFRRPSVLGHFSSATEDTPETEKSRPSISSNGSYSTRPSLDTPSTVPTASGYASTQSSPFRKSSPSLWSLPSSASHLHDLPGSTKLVSQTSRSTIRVPFSVRSSGETRSIYSPSILTSPRTKRKKKYLVISGISMEDEPRFEAVKMWCESFGEIRDITRAPNSDIHVDFRKAEVADTVCRVQARVNIAGVGSVGLSWHTGRRP